MVTKVARTVLIMAHGAGSSADFTARAFPAAGLGCADGLYLDDRTGDTAEIAAALGASAMRQLARGHDVVLGGVSIGAHAAVVAACALAANAPAAHAGATPAGRLAAVLAAMPAWTGTTDNTVRRAMGVLAAEVRVHGAGRVLDRLRRDPGLRDDWVLAELTAAWADRQTLAAELAAATGGAAPSSAQLGALGVPLLVVALADDPLHPMRVARCWSRLAPRSQLVVIDRHAPAADRAVFARAAAAPLAALRSPTGSR